MAVRRTSFWGPQRGHAPQVSGDRPLFERVQELVQRRIRERDLLRRWQPATSQRTSVVSGVLGHLRAKPGRRSKRIRVLSFLELNAEKIQRPGRGKALEEGMLAAAKRHDGALEVHFARTHRHERLGLGARHLRTLFISDSLPPCRENEVAVARLDTDEVVPVGASWEVALDD